MPKYTTIIAGAIALAASALAVVAAQAHSDEATFKDKVNDANLIFLGTVTAVEYGKSEKGPDGVGFPVTDVTFRIDETYRGKFGDDSVKVRFLGGPDGAGNYAFLTGVPIYQKNQRGFIFLKGNGLDASCPIVTCENGWFRVYGGNVFDPYGVPIVEVDGETYTSNGNIPDVFRKVTFPAPKFDDILAADPTFGAFLKRKGYATIDEARKDYEANVQPTTFKMVRTQPASADKGGVRSPAVPLPTKTLKADEFELFLKALIANAAREPDTIVGVTEKDTSPFPLPPQEKPPL